MGFKTSEMIKVENKEWIVAGALCNCLGEGTDTLLIRTVDSKNRRASVCHFRHSIDLSLEQAKECWQRGMYCWESFDKLYQQYITRAQRNFNLVETFGAEALNVPFVKKFELIDVPFPDNIQKTMQEHFGIDERQYTEKNGRYIGTYLAEKILGMSDDLSTAIGVIIFHIARAGVEMALCGEKHDTDGQITLFIKSLGFSNHVADHFVQVLAAWGDASYYQHVGEALKGG